MVVIVALLGLLAGAFVSHVGEAVMVKRPLARPACPHCTAGYAVLQWSAVLALASGQGRCRRCGQYVRVPRLIGEVFTAVTWTLLVARNGFDLRIAYAMAAVLPLTMIMVTDLETKRVPNLIMLPSIAVILLVGAVFGPALPTLTSWTWWYAPAGAAVAFVVLRLFVWLGVAVFGPGAMGEGDITLATYTGAVVGFPLIVVALFLTVTFGGIGAFGVLIARRGSLKTAIPYGPFIILGCAVTMLWGPQILRWFLS